MRKSILILACLSGCNFSNISTNIANNSNLKKIKSEKLSVEFVDYREYTKKLVSEHLVSHSDCDLLKVVKYFDDSVFLFGQNYVDVYAWTFPDAYHNKLFFNTEVDWSPKIASVRIIHEWFHLSKDCGIDTMKTVTPVCRLFGESQYTARDINDVIKKHLKM